MKTDEDRGTAAANCECPVSYGFGYDSSLSLYRNANRTRAFIRAGANLGCFTKEAIHVL
jgi:hypothetical protein